MRQSILIAISVVALSGGVSFANESKTEADNTAKNARDRSGESKTSEDQSNQRVDLAVTQAIRKALMEEKDLSVTAKNVKVITADGQVTLRGPVNSTAEKERVEKLAKRHAGAMKVSNQLEVKQ